MTERWSSARSATWVLAPTVVYAPSTTSRSTVQFSPTKAGESMRTEGSTDEPLPIQMPGRSSKPATSTSTFPSRMSSWALR